jgi:hypothetical protein
MNGGVEPVPMSPGEFDTFVRSEIAVNGALVRSAGLRAAGLRAE